MKAPLRLWWVSFADDERCLGAVIVEAASFIAAVQKTHQLGINPGGEVMALAIPTDAGPEHFDPANRDRLMHPDELSRVLGAKAVKDWEAN